MRILRSALGIVVGLALTSVIVEGLEFGLVSLLHGGVTTDPDLYSSIRNRPGVLAAKLAYNTAAALFGGFVAAWIAGRAPVAHGVTLAVIQTAAFAWALANPGIRRTTPDWMWVCLIVLSAAAIVAGSALHARRRALPSRRPTGGGSVGAG